MSRYITGFGVSKNQDEEKQLAAKGFVKQDANTKQNTRGNAVKLWQKYNNKEGDPPVTRVQFSYNDEMAQGLREAGYTEGDTFPTTEGDVTLWSFCGTTPYDIPIVEFSYSFTLEGEVEVIKNGFEKLNCNFLGGSGYSWYLWVKREKPTYIQDVTATSSYDNDVDLFNKGYTRMDEPTNTIFGGHRSSNFLWYRLTTDPSKSITDLKISTNPEENQQYKGQGYQLVDVNLNNGTSENAVYLWYKRGQGKPVISMTLFFDRKDISTFENGGIKVIEKNINQGNEGERFLCFWQGEKASV